MSYINHYMLRGLNLLLTFYQLKWIMRTLVFFDVFSIPLVRTLSIYICITLTSSAHLQLVFSQAQQIHGMLVLSVATAPVYSSSSLLLFQIPHHSLSLKWNFFTHPFQVGLLAMKVLSCPSWNFSCFFLWTWAPSPGILHSALPLSFIPCGPPLRMSCLSLHCWGIISRRTEFWIASMNLIPTLTLLLVCQGLIPQTCCCSICPFPIDTRDHLSQNYCLRAGDVAH